MVYFLDDLDVLDQMNDWLNKIDLPYR